MRLLRSKLFRLIIVIVSIGIIVTAPGSLYALWKRRDVVGDRQAKRDTLAREVESLKQALAEAQTPEYIERVAREKLGLVREGESVVLMSNDKLQMTNARTEENAIEDQPKWKQWWRMFF